MSEPHVSLVTIRSRNHQSPIDDTKNDNHSLHPPSFSPPVSLSSSPQDSRLGRARASFSDNDDGDNSGDEGDGGGDGDSNGNDDDNVPIHTVSSALLTPGFVDGPRTME